MRALETCYTKPLLFGELTQVTLITISSLLAVVSLARFMILAKKNARNRPIHPMHKYDSSVVGLGGGPATIRQYLQAGLVDHIHLAVSPVLLGSGESLLAGINLLELGYKISEHVSSPAALHVVLTKQTSSNAASTKISIGLRSSSTVAPKTGHNLLLGLRQGAVLCSTLFQVI
jgi:hypothetical protein